MLSHELRQKYLNFFKNRGHKEIPSNPLVPENDPTTLFTSSGMQPIITYLLGKEHPKGTRIVDSQKCFRAMDIEEVGDNRHTTFFEMLGNWSFGDYFKKEEIPWLFEFLTSEVGIDPKKLYVTAFVGDSKLGLDKDEETVKIWQDLFKEKGLEAKVVVLGTEENAYREGMQAGRIFYYTSSKNWWSRAGKPENMPNGEPGGPDTEVFYQFEEIEHDSKFGENCHPNCDCGKFLEIANSVFMQYLKEDGKFINLPKQNVDFGGGLERILTAANNQPDMFKNDLHFPIIEKLCQEFGIEYGRDKNETTSLQIIADHIKASVFLIKDGVLPSNKLQGYILRRLIRRSGVKINFLKEGSMEYLAKLVDPILDIYQETDYFQTGDWEKIRQIILEEIKKFNQTLRKGLKEIEKIDQIDAKKAFDLYQSFGFPIEITAEIFQEKGQEINPKEFEEEFKKHQELSRQSSKELFK